MARYTYKLVRELIPQHIIDDIEDYDYDGGGYDGDIHRASANYIKELVSLLEESRDCILALGYESDMTDKITKAITIDKEQKRTY